MVPLFRTGLRLGQGASGFWSCRSSYLCLAEVCGAGPSLINGGVRPLGVAEPDPAVDELFFFEVGGHFMQVNGLLLQGRPQALDEDIVQVRATIVY